MTSLFSPILRVFETGEGEYAYRKSHRKILIAVGALFFILSCISLFAAFRLSEPAGFFPAIFFLLAATVCEVVALLGSDRAVARIWKSK
jgi:hypothetical protein